MRASCFSTHTRSWSLPAFAATALAIGVLLASAPRAEAYEIWVADQSDTAAERGGYLHVFDGDALVADPAKARPSATFDLGKGVNDFCLKATGKNVRRPHMIFFTSDRSHAVISFLSGQVLIVDAAAKNLEACVAVGKNVHAAWPTPDGKMIITANIAEKAFGRIWTDYAGRTFRFDPASDVLDLASLEDRERPDTAPICPITDASSRYAFVTLRGGGLLVVDVTVTPMRVVATLSNSQVHPAGCGGVQVGQTMYINSGGGWPASKFPDSASLSYDIYALDLSRLPSGISAKLVSTRDNQFADAHGMVAVGRYIWNSDRAGNDIEIVDSLTNLTVARVELAGPLSEDPAPDILAAAPDGSAVFAATRGITPLTGNDPSVNNAKGSSPGIAVIKVTDGGKGGVFLGIARLSNMRDGKETADPHGIAAR